MRKIRIGMIGCGMIGQTFIQNILKNSLFEFIGFYDRNPVSQKTVLKMVPHAQFFPSQEQLFQSKDIEALIICTRHTDHSRQAIEGLKCGKHILIEKPISTNLEDLTLLVQTQKECPSCVVTALPHGKDPILKEARHLAQAEFLGKLVAFHSYLDVPGPPRSNWYYSSSAIGGASLDTLPYALIRLLSFLKCDVKYALGFKNQLIKNRACLDGNNIKTEVDDNASLILEFVEGQQAIVRSSWNVSYPEDYFVIRGRKGDLWMDCWKQTLTLISDTVPSTSSYNEISWQGKKAYRFQFSFANPEELKLRIFHDHIRKKRGNLLEVAYGMKILFKCLFSLENSFFVPPFHRAKSEAVSLSMGEIYV